MGETRGFGESEIRQFLCAYACLRACGIRSQRRVVDQDKEHKTHSPHPVLLPPSAERSPSALSRSLFQARTRPPGLTTTTSTPSHVHNTPIVISPLCSAHFRLVWLIRLEFTTSPLSPPDPPLEEALQLGLAAPVLRQLRGGRWGGCGGRWGCIRCVCRCVCVCVCVCARAKRRNAARDFAAVGACIVPSPSCKPQSPSARHTPHTGTPHTGTSLSFPHTPHKVYTHTHFPALFSLHFK